MNVDDGFDPNLVTAETAAAEVRVSIATIREWVETGELTEHDMADGSSRYDLGDVIVCAMNLEDEAEDDAPFDEVISEVVNNDPRYAIDPRAARRCPHCRVNPIVTADADEERHVRYWHMPGCSVLAARRRLSNDSTTENRQAR